MSIFIDNPVLVFAAIAAVGFTIFMGIKMVEEIQLNKALDLKQRSMRINTMRTGFRSRMAKLATATALPVVVVVTLMFVSIDTTEQPRVFQQNGLTFATINDQQDIKQIIENFSNNQATQQNRNYVNFGGWLESDVVMAMDALVPEGPTAGKGIGDQLTNDNEGTGSDEFSETNNQVDGVDEMDNVLTDGKYMYIMNYDSIQIVLAYTNENTYEVLDIYKEFNFDEFQVEGTEFSAIGMYVDGDNLIVIGNVYETVCVEYSYDGGVQYEDQGEEPAPNPDTDDITTDEMIAPDTYCYNYYSATTKAFVFDKADDFKQTDIYEFSGSFVGTRKIGNSLYFVTTEYIPYYEMYNQDKTRNIDFDLSEYLPSYSVNGQSKMAGYGDITYVEGTDPTNFTAFYGIDLETTKTTMEVVLGEQGYNLYVSGDNMFLAGTVYEYDQALAERYNNDGFEFDEETWVSPYSYYTAILKIAIDDGDVAFASAGTVEGVNLDQFSMDEYNGYLRIITTSNNWWWGGGDRSVINRLSILDEDMNIVSVIDEGIGEPGETVFATRFRGDYGYVVTFLQTDPFYVLDLSDPYNPTILSELKIPGFSDYLQPLNDDFVLGIGYGDNEGGTQGLRVSLYDVSDKNKAAVLADSWTYLYDEDGYMWTSTVYNHKDLLVSVEKGIIAFPYTKNGYNEDTNRWSYNSGILMLNLDLENGELSDKGEEYMIEHSEADSYDTYVYKSKFISDYFYTVSSKYVKVSTIENPNTILKSLKIGESWTYDMPEEVEPVDGDVVVVDPVETCENGFELVDGYCVSDGTNDGVNLLEDYLHINAWNELTEMPEDRYLVYAYGLNCNDCIELQDSAWELGAEQRIPTYFINVDDIDGESFDGFDVAPAIYLIEDGNIVKTVTELGEMLDYMLSVE